MCGNKGSAPDGFFGLMLMRMLCYALHGRTGEVGRKSKGWGGDEWLHKGVEYGEEGRKGSGWVDFCACRLD